MASNVTNADRLTVNSFGHQWSRFDQTAMSETELRARFDEYFRIFPWDELPGDARGVDVGCGSGRWARFVAPRVSRLHCVDASDEAVGVARRNLRDFANIDVHVASVGELPFAEGSLDFAYSLGVLHHVPDTSAALGTIVRALKKGAPLLVYLYYAFDNRPAWYRSLWKSTDLARQMIAKLPRRAQSLVCDTIALVVYWPLARAAYLMSCLGKNVSALPLAVYRDRSFYSMRTDARDRFGTPLEKRFRADEIRQMMTKAGLTHIRFSESAPYWCAVGNKA